MRRILLALVAVGLTAGGMSAVGPRASAADDITPVHHSSAPSQG